MPVDPGDIPKPPRGDPLPWTGGGLPDLAMVRDRDLDRAAGDWSDRVEDPYDSLIVAEEIQPEADSRPWLLIAAGAALYFWGSTARTYRDWNGKAVPRGRVRGVLDIYLDALSAEMEAITRKMVDRRMSLDGWQRRMADLIKKGHVAAMAVGAGGIDQATRDDWVRTSRRLLDEFTHLDAFVRKLASGQLPSNGSVIAWAKMYGVAPTGTYEDTLRAGDILAGFDEERRLTHGFKSCRECKGYAGLGWQPVGILPGIGRRCACYSNCRCTFERRMSMAARGRKRRQLAG